MTKKSDFDWRDRITEMRWNVENFIFRIFKKTEKIFFGTQSPINQAYVPKPYIKGMAHKEDLINTDIVICVHNALEDVKLCISSVLVNTLYSTIIIVDDGSESETQQYLHEVASDQSRVCLLRNETAIGYTKSANLGLKHSTGSYVILLNSDTIVPARWLERLLMCANSSSEIGIVGPLSNAASWQSVPELFNAQGEFMVNKLPTGYTVDQVDAIVEQSHDPVYPDICSVNGFCFLIKRSVMNAIGFLDEKEFPIGYGEEDDYCLRARKANIKLAIADDVYVYHAKSKTFGHDRRKLLSKKGYWSLYRKHGYLKLYNIAPCMQWSASLNYVRDVVKNALENSDKSPC